jgi:radical SAM protein with 4Fe4S-binding SPASM domain
MLVGLYQEARREYAKQGVLFDVHIDLLYQCDLDCQHCYLDDKSPRLQPTSFWTNVLDQLAAVQVFSVIISGGEIFLRPDLLEIVSHARSLGIFVQLKSHGGAIDAHVASELERLGVTSVAISYYSVDPKIHDTITRRPGSHTQTLSAIETLARSSVHVLVSCSVMESNSAGVQDVERQMTKLGVSVSFDGLIRVAQSGDAAPLDTSLDLDGLVDLSLIQDGGKEACLPNESLSDWNSKKNCTAGHMSLYIDPEGVVTPCVAWPESLGDLKEESFKDIWLRSPRLKQIQSMRQVERSTCQSCAIKDSCNYCAGQSYLHSGEPNEPSPVICRANWAQAKANARTQGLPDPPRPPGLAGPQFTILNGAF